MTKKEIVMRKIREIIRGRIDKKNLSRLNNHSFTIICSNCTAGVVYHSLKMQFLTPTINCFMNAPDFIKFCKDLRHYLDAPLKEVPPENNPDVNYPVIACDDILIWAVHYSSFEEFEAKWRERIERINWDNLFFMMTERDYCSDDDVVAFDSLPYKNKVIFLHKDMKEIKSGIHIPGTCNNDSVHKTKSLTAFLHRFSGKRYIDLFDYVSFLNSGVIQLTNKE